MKEPKHGILLFKILIVYDFALMFCPSPIIYTFCFIINNNISELTCSCISFLVLGEYQVCGDVGSTFPLLAVRL